MFPNLDNMILMMEPEAAAIYAARSLKDDKNIEFLRVRLSNLDLRFTDHLHRKMRYLSCVMLVVVQ